jgi:hypothetical protein
VSGIASLPDVLGENYVDASGRTYLPMIRQPIMIFAGSAEQIRAVYDSAVGTDAAFSIYTAELFSTPHDEANRAAVKARRSEELDLVGLALRGRKKLLEKVLQGLRLHS